MRISRLFGATLRDSPASAECASHQLLLRAGFIRQLGQGLFSSLHLARRSLDKIENIMREEINAIGGQEITMPVVHPAEIWKATGRWDEVGPEMARLKDRRGRDLVLAMTHEEVVADLCKSEIHSYRHLPRLIYHIQTKFRDDARPRAGLIRTREFTMKDSYSLDVDEAGLDEQYQAHYRAYFKIFERCGLSTRAVGSDVGMMGGSMAHEFMYLAPIGEDTIVLCSGCEYAANRQIARFAKGVPEEEPAGPLKKVATPGAHTIDALAEFLQVPASKTAKAVMFAAGSAAEPEAEGDERIVLAIVRGDMEINETKLANAIGAAWLVPATDEQILAIGVVPGYASPVGLEGVEVVVDDAIPVSANLAAGANEEGFHYLNVNVPRDYVPTKIADIAVARPGDPCVDCGSPLFAERGVELGNIFKLGTRYTESVGATFTDRDGSEQPIVMGSYGIGSGRLLACVAEEYHDERGLMWPATVAPYEVHLVRLDSRNPEVQVPGDATYERLQSAGLEVLYDDRKETPGVKFADADLIGAPLRVTVSERSIKKGGLELKRRDSDSAEIVPEDELIDRLQQELEALLAGVAAQAAAGRVAERKAGHQETS